MDRVDEIVSGAPFFSVTRVRETPALPFCLEDVSHLSEPFQWFKKWKGLFRFDSQKNALYLCPGKTKLFLPL